MNQELQDSYDIVIIGGGVAGLCAALSASTSGGSVAVLDAHPIGGRARSVDRRGFTLNQGAHALYLEGAFAKLLVANGIAIAGGSPRATTMNLLRDGRLTPQTFTAAGLGRSKLLGVRSRAKALALFARLAKMRTDEWVGRPAAEWLADTPDDLRQIVEMLIRLSTYSNDPAHLDAGAAIGQLRQGQRGVRYIDGGWQRLVDSISAVLGERGVVIASGFETTRVESGRVISADREIAAQSIVLAAGGPALVERLVGHPALGAAALTAPSTATVLDLCLARPHDGLSMGLDRPYYLSPHAPVATLAPVGSGLVSLMAYHAPDNVRPIDVTRTELRDLARLNGISDAEVVDERFLAKCVVAHGGPAAAAGGLAGRPTMLAAGLDGVFLAGDWVGPEGFIADCSAASGAAAGLAAVASLEAGALR
jgi:phytoene dehydrogenase-like protein